MKRDSLSLSLSPLFLKRLPFLSTLSLRHFIGLDSEFVTHDVPGTGTTISNTRHQTRLTYFATILDPTMTRYFAKVVVHERSIYLLILSLPFPRFFPFFSLLLFFFFLFAFRYEKSYSSRTRVVHTCTVVYKY